MNAILGRRRIRWTVLALVGLLPNVLKKPLYRLFFGYRFAGGVRVGFAVVDAEHVDLGAGTRIGHLNVITRVDRLETGCEVRIGGLNIIRGGERVTLGDYSEVMRFNVLNAIPDHDCTTEPESVLEVGAGTVITSGHRIDFTDKVTLGKNVIIGGRNSSLWTHNRQETAPIEIGDFCYLGSEVRLAPGAKLPERVHPRTWVGPDRRDHGTPLARGGRTGEGRPSAERKGPRPHPSQDAQGHARRLLRALIAIGYACRRERPTRAPPRQIRVMDRGGARCGARPLPRRGRHGPGLGTGDTAFRDPGWRADARRAPGSFEWAPST